MDRSYSRRDFLRQGAGAVILGLPLLASGCRRPDTTERPPEQSADEVLALARARMARDVKPGVVIVIPEDPTMAARRESELAALKASSAPQALEQSDSTPPAQVEATPVSEPRKEEGQA